MKKLLILFVGFALLFSACNLGLLQHEKADVSSPHGRAVSGPNGTLEITEMRNTSMKVTWRSLQQV